MCGRYTLKASAQELIEAFELAHDDGLDLAPDPASERPPVPLGAPPLTWSPRFNIAPTQSLPIIANVPGPRLIRFARWGLVPSWAKDPKIGSRMINARSETVADKPSFRSPFRRQRCLVPADGFYEWQRVGKAKRPMHIGLDGGGLFAMAGLWERWLPRDAPGDAAPEPLHTFTVLTTTPNPLLAPIHDRMPVILPRDAWDLWLSPDDPGRSALQPLLTPYPAEAMATFEVDTLVNSARNDVPACAAPVSRLL